jgi:hypothetical protein
MTIPTDPSADSPTLNTQAGVLEMANEQYPRKKWDVDNHSLETRILSRSSPPLLPRPSSETQVCQTHRQCDPLPIR